MPLLSIITINYNNLNGLKKTVQSVLCQTSKEFEYIIVDGGSNDGSAEYISTCAKEETSIEIKWVSEKDTGIYNAMNKGILISKGKYLQFLNSGDCIVNEIVTERMIKSLKPDCNILYGNMLKNLPKGLYCDKGFSGRKPTFVDFFYGTLNHSPAYIKRDLFNQFGFYDENLKIVSDWKWYLNVLILNNITVDYTNIDVTLFDMNGISNVNNHLDKSERQQVLSEMLPENIYTDYLLWGNGILAYQRIQKFPVLSRVFYLFDRYVSWLERKRNNNYIKS